MGKLWTETENKLFLNILYTYRDDIRGKENRQIVQITKEYAYILYRENQILESRTLQAIYEHLSYFDDLTAGVGSLEEFAKKDGKYFSKNPRTDNSVKSNPARVFRSKEKYLK
jgi:hypothetical protein